MSQVITNEKIKEYSVEINTGNDHFNGSKKEQEMIVDSLKEDSSQVESKYLYYAANTAVLLDRVSDAIFFYFAARLRKNLEVHQYNLGVADGNNLITYLNFLDQSSGASINPLVIKHPEDFFQAMEKLKDWNVVASVSYGEVFVSEEQAQGIAKALQQEFFDQYVAKQKEILSNPEILEAVQFVQDYNFGVLPQNDTNTALYEKYIKIVQEKLQ